mmetsp:Transcript_48053/g.57944  ORF Transcript_48053/g.57944 Transcript_48053/m.57944 type:complete len:100 (-) Transcript_48053:1735-2034(-)
MFLSNTNCRLASKAYLKGLKYFTHVANAGMLLMKNPPTTIVERLYTVATTIARSMSITLVPISKPMDSPESTLSREQAVLPMKTVKLRDILPSQNDTTM